MGTTNRVLTDAMIDEIKAYFPRYPTRRAVTLPALHVVNTHLRHVPPEAVVEIAALLGLAPAEVQDTLTFYGFFKQAAPHGETRAWVCRSISCALRGGEEVLDHLCRRAGIRPGETTPDGKLTVEAAECLGVCEAAPCLLAEDNVYGDLTVEKAERFLKDRGVGTSKDHSDE
jgi:NADH-quinone oxidoreductase subunit E